jgi:phosphatidylserine decarboxylase
MSGPQADSTHGDASFAALQRWLPQHLLSALMHRLARSRLPCIRRLLIRTVLRTYPMIDMSEAVEPDPYAYPSFNAFFTRSLRPAARQIAADQGTIVSPVDGTVSQLGRIDAGRMLQAKGRNYTLAALLDDVGATERYADGSFACLYLAPYNYHRIHMPCDARLVRSRYVPGALFSVNASTSRAVPDLYARNERLVCEFETRFGPMALVMVGALLVGSIETVYAGEINPPRSGRGIPRDIERGIGLEFVKGAEIGRFNMGSTVILICAKTAPALVASLVPGDAIRLGQAMAAAPRS